MPLLQPEDKRVVLSYDCGLSSSNNVSLVQILTLQGQSFGIFLHNIFGPYITV